MPRDDDAPGAGNPPGRHERPEAAPTIWGDRVDENRHLTRGEAKKAAFELFNTDSPAVVELLLLAHNQDADVWKKYAANQALTWFDPDADLPEVRLPEPPALRAIRWACYACDPEARKHAAEVAAFHLGRWQ